MSCLAFSLYVAQSVKFYPVLEVSWLDINPAGAKLINMNTSHDKDILMRKSASYEFGCTNILYLMFELLSIYWLYQNKLVETIRYSEIVKPNILLRKLKQKKKNEKRKTDGWWRDMW